MSFIGAEGAVSRAAVILRLRRTSCEMAGALPPLQRRHPPDLYRPLLVGTHLNKTCPSGRRRCRRRQGHPERRTGARNWRQRSVPPQRSSWPSARRALPGSFEHERATLPCSFGKRSSAMFSFLADDRSTHQLAGRTRHTPAVVNRKSGRQRTARAP